MQSLTDSSTQANVQSRSRQGQTGIRGIAISFPYDVGELVQTLPRPQHDCAIIVRQQLADRGSRASQPTPPPPQVTTSVPNHREFRVLSSNIRQALQWLQNRNVHYAVIIAMPPDGEYEQGTDNAADSPENMELVRNMQHSVMLESDPTIGRAALRDQILHQGHNAREMERNLYFDLRWNCRRTCSMFILQSIEALAFPCLYPTGRGHWGAARNVKITLINFFRQRCLNADARFQQNPNYIGFAVSTMQHCQLTGCVGVALRQMRGPKAIGAIRESAAGTSSVANAAIVSDRAWSFTKGIRGTAAYWQINLQDRSLRYDEAVGTSHLVYDTQC